MNNLENTDNFQDLLVLIFQRKYNCGLLIRNAHTDERLSIRVTKHDPYSTIVTFETYGKHKKRYYYHDTLILCKCDTDAVQRSRITDFIVYDKMLLPFFL